MQERRYRPGDVLDDYCPRERRITDHAIVAMIDDEIRRTRCGVCDTEHEYKEAKLPAPRRKTQPPALFNQVLEGMNGPTRPHPAADPAAEVAASAEPALEESTSAPAELRRDTPATMAAAEVPAPAIQDGVAATPPLAAEEAAT